MYLETKETQNATAPPITEAAKIWISEKPNAFKTKPLPTCSAKALESAKEIAKIIKHQASSIATTPKRESVKLPLLLYARTTITVAAGAVADGKIGPKSLEAINGMNPEVFGALFAVYKLDRYLRIIGNNHTQAKFAKGWANRTLSVLNK